MSPFQALYGKIPTLIPPYQKGTNQVEAVDMMLVQRDQVLSHLKLQLSRAQQRMKDQADRHRQERIFQVGDKVLIKLQPYRHLSVAKHSCYKLAKRYFGPYSVEKVISPVAYRVALPEGSLIHPTFHVSLLKPFYGNSDISYSPLPAQSKDNKPLQVPIAVVGARQIIQGGREVHQYLVQWSSSVPEDASWEDAAEFRRAYPSIQLEDKFILEGEADVSGKEDKVSSV